MRTDEPRLLRVRAEAADATGGAVWSVRLSDRPPVTVRTASGRADAELAGPADRLYLALWNRGTVPSVTGDAALAALWREKSAI